MAVILLVEDDDTLGMTLEMSLTSSGHEVRWCRTLRAAREALDERPPSLLILDLGLPDGDGLDLCREVRKRRNFMPIIILTARESLHSRVQGLDMGADDYVAKPFELPELLARVDALLRRQKWHGCADRVLVGRLLVDFERHDATRDGEKVQLTDLELRLLRHLVEQGGRVVSREELLADVWGLPPSTRTRSVDVFIGRLRRFVEEDSSRPRVLLNVRGVGYRLVGTAWDSDPGSPEG